MADYSNENPYYTNLQDGGLYEVPAGAWSSQFGGDGLDKPFYNTDGAPLQNVTPVLMPVYFEPTLIGQGPMRQQATQAFVTGEAGNTGGTGFQSREFIAHELPMMRNTVADYWSPAAPTRRDPYAQSYQLSSGQYYAGQSPQRGIYTGVEDM